MKKVFYSVFSLLFIMLSINADAQERGEVVLEELMASYTVTEVEDLYNSVDPTLAIVLPPEFGVDEYKITYQTIDADGSSVIATGVLALPSTESGFWTGNAQAPIGIYNHGTFTDNASIPSNFGTEHFLSIVFAATGYIGLVPDLVGYGDSPGFPNYQHAKSTGTANVDMIRAARDFCNQRSLPLNGQVFITGYSQGGHAAMAAHKEIETFHADEIQVTASAPLSGTYDLSGVQSDFVFADDFYEGNVYLGFIAVAWKEIYPDLLGDLEYDEVFVAPYDTLIPQLMIEFETSLGEFNSLLPTNPSDLLTEEFKDGYFNDPDFPFIVALQDNNVYEWTPQAPMRMGYCEADQSITYQNAIVALEQFETNGSTTAEAVSYGESFGHGECISFALLGTKNWFDSMAQFTAIDTELGIDSPDYNSKMLSVYPNPMQYQSIITLIDRTAPISDIRIFDIKGNLVRQYDAVNQYHHTIHKTDLSPGMYIINVNTSQRTFTKKLIVK